MRNYYTFTIASHYASAIVNNDYSGLADQDEADLNAFLLAIDLLEDSLYGLQIEGEESFFALDEVSGLMADCVEFRLYTGAK